MDSPLHFWISVLNTAVCRKRAVCSVKRAVCSVKRGPADEDSNKAPSEDVAYRSVDSKGGYCLERVVQFVKRAVYSVKRGPEDADSYNSLSEDFAYQGVFSVKQSVSSVAAPVSCTTRASIPSKEAQMLSRELLQQITGCCNRL